MSLLTKGMTFPEYGDKADDSASSASILFLMLPRISQYKHKKAGTSHRTMHKHHRQYGWHSCVSQQRDPAGIRICACKGYCRGACINHGTEVVIMPCAKFRAVPLHQPRSACIRMNCFQTYKALAHSIYLIVNALLQVATYRQCGCLTCCPQPCTTILR
jgi:hypothetical protein